MKLAISMSDNTIEAEEFSSGRALKQLNVDLPRYMHKLVRAAATEKEVTIKQWLINVIEVALKPVAAQVPTPGSLSPECEMLEAIRREGTPEQWAWIKGNVITFLERIRGGVRADMFHTVESQANRGQVSDTVQTTIDPDIEKSLTEVTRYLINRDASRNVAVILRSKNKLVHQIMDICAEQLADGIGMSLTLLEADKVKANVARAKFVADAISERSREKSKRGLRGGPKAIRVKKSRKNEPHDHTVKGSGIRETGTD